MGVYGTTIVIGATPVVNGTSTRVLYNNAGAVGEMTTTGSGTQLVLATSPTITTPTIAKLANLTTNGFVKTSGGDGTLSVDTATYITGLTVGTTTVSSGTTTRILYDNAGVLGEYTLTGTGTVVVMQTDPSLLNTATVTRTSIGATSTDGLILTNTTAAAAGAQQFSPRLRLTGQGWKTTATATSQTVDFVQEVQPVQGSANPTANLVWSSQINGAGYNSRLTLDDTGHLNLSANGTVGAPILTFGGTTTGFYIGSGVPRAAAGGVFAFQWQAGYLQLGSDGAFTWTSGAGGSGASDMLLYRGGAATLQMGQDVNGAAVSQQLQACNGITGTDKTGGNLTIASGKGTGAGAVSSLIFQTPTVLGSGTTAQSLATRLTISSASVTSPISMIAQNATAIPTGGTAGAGFMFSSTANYGVFFGSGAPSLSAAKGSLYLRSDGTGTTDRAYINTDGSTTWTAITTVA
jgi:hypothetical protein